MAKSVTGFSRGPKRKTAATKNRRAVNGDSNRLYPEDRPVHDWYRFVLSFPPHLVRDYLQRFGVNNDHLVLDPFCGTGTTLVECKKLGISSVGIEANPIACFASQVKVDWSVDPDGLVRHALQVADAAFAELETQEIDDESLPLFRRFKHQGHESLRKLPPEKETLLLKDSISPLPLHKVLVLLDYLRKFFDERYSRHELLALAKSLVYSISNLQFGPEVGISPAKSDAPVVATWLSGLRAMAEDLRVLQGVQSGSAMVYNADSRQIRGLLKSNSVDVVFTSPPYPNEKDYTRTTRLESVLLDFIRDRKELQGLKRTLVRSNTRGVYKNDDDDKWVTGHSEIERLAKAIEQRRLALGKTSGFERLYPRVTKLYFGGMTRHLAELRDILSPGAQLAYVVGDQASYLRIMIRTGRLLADIAQSLGYELIGIELFRTRLATATREQLREEVVVLRWPSKKRIPRKRLRSTA